MQVNDPSTREASDAKLESSSEKRDNHAIGRCSGYPYISPLRPYVRSLTGSLPDSYDGFVIYDPSTL